MTLWANASRQTGTRPMPSYFLGYKIWPLKCSVAKFSGQIPSKWKISTANTKISLPHWFKPDFQSPHLVIGFHFSHFCYFLIISLNDRNFLFTASRFSVPSHSWNTAVNSATWQHCYDAHLVSAWCPEWTAAIFCPLKK